MPPNPKPNLQSKHLNFRLPVYLDFLIKDANLTIEIHKLWPDLERLILATQRGMVEADENAIGGVKACGEILNIFQLFSEKGKRDLEALKKLP